MWKKIHMKKKPLLPKIKKPTETKNLRINSNAWRMTF
jgi:hypothetical protein